ncbi:MAG TPA: response regulator transcription factor [Terracidiphilus sp.]|nr:response regulator transcription factor [Terracidiphilus sp.]
MQIQVLLADDHPIVRDGLRAILESEGFKVAGEASNGREAVELSKKIRPDVAVLDLAMPLLNGIDAARELARISPNTKTILLTMHTERQFILEGLRAGTRGFVMKSHSAQELVHAIREIARGGTYFSPEVARAAVEAYRSNGDMPEDPLTPRERQVLQLVAESKTTKEIAALLEISVKTVETYRSRIMEKLGIHETAGIVRYAIRHGVVQP